MNAYGEVLYNTSREFFCPLQGAEKYCTAGFKELAVIYGAVEDLFRKTAALLNRVRHQPEGGTPFRTIREIADHEGSLLQAHLEQKTAEIFQAHGFTSEGGPPEVLPDLLPCNPAILAGTGLIEHLRTQDLSEAWKTSILDNPVGYEDIRQAVNISLDDVGTKKQKAQREKKPPDPPVKKNRVYVQNTVIHVEKGGHSYLLNGYGVVCVLRRLLAFLLYNNLLRHTLIFFVDGHSLYGEVIQFFAWHKNLSVILDWYHLQKKCQELLSMALKGRERRNPVLEKLWPLLWHGLVDQALRYLESVPAAEIKNGAELVHLIGYLAKNRPMIPAYAIRRELGLRNSSNRGEKANDLLVAARQKHKGRSWSKGGSVALASVTALKQNQEYPQWFRERELEFKFAASQQKYLHR